jgi:hypothetical protein
MWRLRDVITSTMLETAAIRFVTRSEAAATVRLTKESPVSESGTEFKTFPGAPLQLYVHETRDALASSYTAAPRVPLERNTWYHYIIDVPGDGGRIPRQQYVGAVRTLRQTAEIWFTEIQIVSDGDPDGPGELEFIFNAEDRWRTIGPDDGAELNWSDGSRNPIKVALGGFTADRIGICVSGFDDDRSTSSALPPGDPCRESITPVGANHNYEWNTARTQVDLTQHPGASANIPLYFRSRPLGSGSKLMFDVRGYVSVRRE